MADLEKLSNIDAVVRDGEVLPSDDVLEEDEFKDMPSNDKIAAQILREHPVDQLIAEVAERMVVPKPKTPLEIKQDRWDALYETMSNYPSREAIVAKIGERPEEEPEVATAPHIDIHAEKLAADLAEAEKIEDPRAREMYIAGVHAHERARQELAARPGGPIDYNPMHRR